VVVRAKFVCRYAPQRSKLLQGVDRAKGFLQTEHKRPPVHVFTVASGEIMLKHNDFLANFFVVATYFFFDVAV